MKPGVLDVALKGGRASAHRQKGRTIVMGGLTFDAGVAARIRAAMEQAGVGGAELGRRIGVRPETIRDWAGGSGFPSQAFHEVLARALGVSVEWLFNGAAASVPLPEDCVPTCERSRADEETLAPECGPAAWQELLAERRGLDARKKAVVDEVEARVREIDEQLWPLFSDEHPRLEHEGYSLTRVVPEPRVTVTWDVERALEGRQGDVLRAMLLPYRSEQVKASRPYLRSTSKGGSRS